MGRPARSDSGPNTDGCAQQKTHYPADNPGRGISLAHRRNCLWWIRRPSLLIPVAVWGRVGVGSRGRRFIEEARRGIAERHLIVIRKSRAIFVSERSLKFVGQRRLRVKGRIDERRAISQTKAQRIVRVSTLTCRAAFHPFIVGQAFLPVVACESHALEIS